MKFIYEYNIFKNIKNKIKNYFKITNDEYENIYDLFIVEFEDVLKEKKYPEHQLSSHIAFIEADNDIFIINYFSKSNTIVINIKLCYDDFSKENGRDDFKSKLKIILKKLDRFKNRIKKFGFKISISYEESHPQYIYLRINK